MASGRNCWLMKSDPDYFSLDDLKNAPGGTTCRDGVRNHQARNLLRDRIRGGDGVLFQHSNIRWSAIGGIAQVGRGG
ncbi:EVE domain-containing protein [Geothermobacter ehrlichii]|uniref:EVE domain-containing protein n=1 Tax=Geothermobacter ehrlichii TaxID=213224 RepID=A0A5D3WPI7_9BACT|nr:EVE domain-containing protein [Geothermobacter ehrlichii]TYP00117.1 EVE domain-containing protein [Geothermobacter ehrlichii]